MNGKISNITICSLHETSLSISLHKAKYNVEIDTLFCLHTIDHTPEDS